MEENHITNLPVGIKILESKVEEDVCLWYATGDCVSAHLYTNPNKDCDGHRKCFAYVSKIKHDKEFKKYK